MIIICGAGITGPSIARELVAQGIRDIRIIEKESFFWKARFWKKQRSASCRNLLYSRLPQGKVLSERKHTYETLLYLPLLNMFK